LAYIVISEFVDLDDRHHFYHEGDVYPREGYTPSEDRVNALLTGNNAIGEQFIRRRCSTGIDGGNNTIEGAIPAPTLSEAEIDAAPEPKRRGRPRKSE
jgi:hypothetical protein